MQNHQERMRIRKERVRTQKATHLPDTLEFMVEDLQRNLMTLTDLSVALERERLRLNELASNNKIECDEIRVVSALLTVFRREVERLRADVAEVEGIFVGVLSENGVNPIVPETWCKSSLLTRTRNAANR